MDWATRSVWKGGHPKGQPDLTRWGRHSLTQCLATLILVLSCLVVPSQAQGCLCSPKNRKPSLWVMQQWVKPSASVWDLLVEGSPCRGTAPLHPASELRGNGTLGQRWFRRECHWRKLSDYDMILPISSFFLLMITMRTYSFTASQIQCAENGHAQLLCYHRGQFCPSRRHGISLGVYSVRWTVLPETMHLQKPQWK